MQSAQATGTEPAEREITLTRLFDAPPEIVFLAWTDPAHLAHWWGPAGFTNPVCEVDARPGGKLRIVMRSPSGSEHAMRGVFEQVVPPELLAFTNIAVDEADQPIIDGFTTVKFQRDGTKTRLTVTTRGRALTEIARGYLKGMETGWSMSLDKLAAHVQKS